MKKVSVLLPVTFAVALVIAAAGCSTDETETSTSAPSDPETTADLPSEPTPPSDASLILRQVTDEEVIASLREQMGAPPDITLVLIELRGYETASPIEDAEALEAVLRDGVAYPDFVIGFGLAGASSEGTTVEALLVLFVPAHITDGEFPVSFTPENGETVTTTFVTG